MSKKKEAKQKPAAFHPLGVGQAAGFCFAGVVLAQYLRLDRGNQAFSGCSSKYSRANFIKASAAGDRGRSL